jgi:hypothetical protein
MRADVKDLTAVRNDDLYLDVVGLVPLPNIPPDMRDELTEILVGWRDEGRDTSWTQLPLPQLGF